MLNRAPGLRCVYLGRSKMTNAKVIHNPTGIGVIHKPGSWVLAGAGKRRTLEVHSLPPEGNTMNRYEVDAAQVSAASAAAGKTAATLRSEVASMMRHLHDLSNSWRGSAANSFSGLITDWSATQTKVEQSLDQITQALSHAAQTYSDAEQQAARLFRR